MGMFWHYYAVPRERWGHVFGGNSPKAVKQVLASYMWDKLDGSEPDLEEDEKGWHKAILDQAPEALVHLVKDLCKNGFSYTGRSAEETEMMDELVPSFFCPEGLEELLDASALSENGIKSFVIEELIDRSKAKKVGGFLGFGGKMLPATPVELLHFMLDGRRFGTNEHAEPYNEYVFFAEHELAKLKQEIELLLSLDRPWSHPDIEIAIKEELLDVVISAQSSKGILFGSHG